MNNNVQLIFPDGSVKNIDMECVSKDYAAGESPLSMQYFEQVILPDGITNIGDNVFAQCKYLKIINIPNTVERIGVNAFFGTTRLESIILPNSVTSLGEYCFYKSGIKNIVFSYGLTSLPTCCFGVCFCLEKINIPENIILLGNNCFCGCNNLEMVNLPSNLVFVEKDCFADCHKLRVFEWQGVTYRDCIPSIVKNELPMFTDAEIKVIKMALDDFAYGKSLEENNTSFNTIVNNIHMKLDILEEKRS